MIDWIKTAQRVAAIVAAIFATMVAWWSLGLPRLAFSPEAPIHARVEALEQFNHDTRLLVPDQILVAHESARHALAGDGCRVRVIEGGNGGPPTNRAAPGGRPTLGQSGNFMSSRRTGARRRADDQRDDRETALALTQKGHARNATTGQIDQRRRLRGGQVRRWRSCTKSRQKAGNRPYTGRRKT
jgi:hypothetical protein